MTSPSSSWSHTPCVEPRGQARTALQRDTLFNWLALLVLLALGFAGS